MQSVMSGRISKHFPHNKSQGTRSAKEASRPAGKLARAGSGLQATAGDHLFDKLLSTATVYHLSLWQAEE